MQVSGLSAGETKEAWNVQEVGLDGHVPSDLKLDKASWSSPWGIGLGIRDWIRFLARPLTSCPPGNAAL